MQCAGAPPEQPGCCALACYRTSASYAHSEMCMFLFPLRVKRHLMGILQAVQVLKKQRGA